MLNILDVGLGSDVRRVSQNNDLTGDGTGLGDGQSPTDTRNAFRNPPYFVQVNLGATDIRNPVGATNHSEQFSLLFELIACSAPNALCTWQLEDSILDAPSRMTTFEGFDFVPTVETMGLQQDPPLGGGVDDGESCRRKPLSESCTTGGPKDFSAQGNLYGIGRRV